MRRKFRLLPAALGLLVLILDSRSAAAAAAEGIELCIRTVIPCLFPFFVLSIYLTGSAGGGTAAVWLSGFLGGYPVGAQAAAQAYRNGYISRNHANRLLMFCSQAGPSFLFGMAAAQFPEAKYGWMLWAVQILSALSVAWMVPAGKAPPIAHGNPTPLSMPQAMKKAVHAMASVCGWVVLFRVVIVFLQTWVFGRFPAFTGIAFSGLLELTNGCLLLREIQDIPLRFFTAALMLNFGGICVLMQTASVTEGLNIGKYILGKLMQTLFSTLWAALFLGKFYTLIPLFFILFLPSLRNLRKNSSIPAPVGV